MINMFPDILKPCVVLQPFLILIGRNLLFSMLLSIAGRFLTNVPSYIDRSIKHLQPIIEERRRQMKEHGDDWQDKPVSTISRDTMNGRAFILTYTVIAIE